MTLATTTAAARGTAQGRALDLLASGVPQESVASAIGVTPSYISQLLSDEEFAAEVARRKYERLTEHNARDAKYDALEDKLLGKLEKALPLMFKPLDITRALTAINGAKRRGLDSSDSIVPQQNLVEITMPTQIIQNFTTNVMNQVVKAGDQDLTTIQSGDLLKKVEGAPEEEKREELSKIQEQGETPEIFATQNTILESL